MGRVQNKNLIPVNERPEEEARAIRSAGGKAKAEQQRQKKAAAELMQIFCDLPVSDGRRKNRLKRLGFADEDLNNKALMIAAIGQAAQLGNVYAFEKVLSLLGEDIPAPNDQANNLLDAIIRSTQEDIDTDGIPELQQASASDDDMVEPEAISEL